jgi:hypothetical protein
VGLPERELAASGSYFDGCRHQCPHPAQLPAEQPLQEDAEADVRTVSPLPPLLTNPQADIILPTFLLLQPGQLGLSLPKTRYSNSSLHFLQRYS